MKKYIMHKTKGITIFREIFHSQLFHDWLQHVSIFRTSNICITQRYFNIIFVDIHLDVLDHESAEKAVDYTIKKYTRIDVLVNNAGYELMGALENLTMEQIKKQFDTNVIGLINMTILVVPHMRKVRSGSILNVASIGGRLTFPLMSMYHSSKFAVEGFSQGLLYELKDHNIKVKLIEPGLIYTNFYSNLEIPTISNDNPYKAITNNVVRNSIKGGESGSHPSVVAKTIFKAANSNNNKIHYPTGKLAKSLLWLSQWMPGYFRTIAYNSMAK